MKNIVILGAGNTTDEIIPILESLSKNKDYKVKAIIDDDKKYFKKSYKGIPIHIGLENAKKFENCFFVFGIGSYTYQYNTRDTFGFALKSTLCVIKGDEKLIFKDPKTDNGIKKSQKGRVVVLKDGNSFTFTDGFSLNDVVSGDQLREVFRDGELLIDENFADIRARISAQVK